MEISAITPITTDAIAQALGVPVLLVEQWEHGEKEMHLTPVETLTLCTALDYTLQDLVALYISWAK